VLGSAVLEVAIGIVFVYSLVSLLCTAIREGIEAWFKTRAAYLEHAIRELLHDREGTNLASHLYRHPLIYSLFSGEYSRLGKDGKPRPSPLRPPLLAAGGDLPSYIPARNFALALMDIVANGPSTDAVDGGESAPVLSIDRLHKKVPSLNNAPVERAVLTAIDSAQGDLKRVQGTLEAWFDSAMDRTSGWYKRSTHWVLFWIGLALAVALNINTLAIADYLYRNDAARAAGVAAAQRAATNPVAGTEMYERIRTDLDKMGLPIGWSNGWGVPRTREAHQPILLWNDCIAPVLGWILTAFAATLGAPFWFDLLNKSMVIRATVKPHEKSPEEASQDRQRAAPASDR
jgi:hypothetical protein